jgi:hypothetical protein
MIVDGVGARIKPLSCNGGQHYASAYAALLAAVLTDESIHA